MELLDLLQWPAMLVTVLAAWLVGSRDHQRRRIGFWVFLTSNALWIVWGLPAKAYALVLLQVCLGAMNIRGSRKNRQAEAQERDAQSQPARRSNQ